MHEAAERIRQVMTWGVSTMRRCIWPVRLADRNQGAARAGALEWCRANCRGAYMDAYDPDEGWGLRFEHPADVSDLVMAEEEGRL